MWWWKNFSAGRDEAIWPRIMISVAPTNPRLVYCSISAYGRQGTFCGRGPGFDPITQPRKRVHVAERAFP